MMEIEKNKVIELYKEYRNLQKVAQLTNTTAYYVKKIIKEANIEQKTNKKVLFSDELIDTIKTMYNDGKSETEIAECFSVHHYHIVKALTSLGIRLNHHERKFNQIANTIGLEYKRLYEQGLTVNQIAEKTGNDRHTVSKWLKANNVKIVNPTTISLIDENVFDCIDTEEKAYWLGFIYADGSITSEPLTKKTRVKYGFEIALLKPDIEHLYKFNTFIKHTHKDHVKVREFKQNGRIFHVCRWCITNKHLWETLNSYGCTPRKSLTLVFPDTSIFKDKDLVKHFIRGYFDGDGCLSFARLNEAYCTPICSMVGTKEFLSSILTFLQNNGIMCNNTILKDKRRLSSNTYTLSITKKDTNVLFLNYLYKDSTIYLNRKYERYLLLQNGEALIQNIVNNYNENN